MALFIMIRFFFFCELMVKILIYYKFEIVDSLASKGIILDQYYVQSVCSPSRAAMLTGKKKKSGKKEEFSIPNTSRFIPFLK